MDISQKDFSDLTSIMSQMTKTLKNFDDRLNEVENNIAEIGETVTVELPKVIAEQVGEAVDTAVAEVSDANAEVVPAEGEPCSECGNNPCTCEGAAEVVTTEGTEFCGDTESFEEFSEKVTTTIENLTKQAADIAERVNKMFVKVFSEGDDQINDVTEDETDVQKVETALKEDPKKVVTEEEPQITDEKKPEVKAEVIVAEVKPEAPVNPAPVVEPAPVDEKKQFSTRYTQVKGIFNL